MVTKNETARARAVGTKQEDPETAALVEQEEVCDVIHTRCKAMNPVAYNHLFLFSIEQDSSQDSFYFSINVWSTYDPIIFLLYIGSRLRFFDCVAACSFQ